MKEKYKHLLQKRSFHMAVGGLSLCLIALVTWAFSPKPSTSPLDIFVEEKTIEWGETVSLDPASYLKEGCEPGEIMDQIVIQSDLDEVPDIGEYTLSLIYGEQQRPIRLTVQDTTAPVFEKTYDRIETYQDVEPNLEDISVTDLGEVSLGLDLSQVDLTQPGEYPAVLLASDPSQNQATQTISIVVKAPQLTLEKNHLSLIEGQSSTLKANVEGKDPTIQYSSSQPEIVSVDAQGKIHAQKAGKATITALANGIEATCQVEVKEKPKEEMPTTDTDSNTSDTHIPAGINVQSIAQLQAAKNSDNLLIIASPSYASRSMTAYFFQKNGSGWSQTFKVNGIVGKTGIGKASEGDTKTPTGIYSITKLFGIDPNPGTQLAYHQLTGTEYWCGGPYYNQWVDEQTMDHSNCDKSKDEHLIDYPVNYDYAAAISYNTSNTPGQGSAIFVHCMTGSYTLGCIAIPKTQMATFMRGINGSTRVIIDVESRILNY